MNDTPVTFVPPNRAYETDSEHGKFFSMTLLKIDTAIIEYMRDSIKPKVIHEEHEIVVPVIYGDPEKWKAIQKDGVFRDSKGKVQAPIIMVHRTTTTARENVSSPVNRYLSSTLETGWNKRTVYDKFNILNGINPSREFITTILPDHVTLTYECIIWTETIEQINNVVEQINFASDEFWGKKDSFRFQTTIKDFSQTTEAPSTEDRIVKSTFSLTVQAYLLPERMTGDNNISVTTSQKAYSIKKVVLSEHIMISK